MAVSTAMYTFRNHVNSMSTFSNGYCFFLVLHMFNKKQRLFSFICLLVCCSTSLPTCFFVCCRPEKNHSMNGENHFYVEIEENETEATSQLIPSRLKLVINN